MPCRTRTDAKIVTRINECLDKLPWLKNKKDKIEEVRKLFNETLLKQ